MRRLILAVCVLLTCAALTAATSATNDVGIRVTVRSASGGGTIHGSYVALIPPYRPWGRPLAERIAPDGVALFRVPPGSYRIVAVAPDFASSDAGPLTVSAAANNAVDLRLTPLNVVRGSVTDAAGNPLAGARIFVGYAAGPPGLGNFSESHRRAILDARATTTDANGAWALPVAPNSGTPLVIQKRGYVTVARLYRPDQPQTADFVLQPGAASVRATLDRTDAGVLLTLRRLGDAQSSAVPAEWQPKVWGQRPLTTTVSWDGLAPGTYEIVAKYTDPRSFAQAYTRLRSIVLAAGETADVAVRLPPQAPPAERVVRLFVPNVPDDELQHVQAFGVTEAGTSVAVPFSIEEATGGTVLYLDAEAAHAPFYATTSDRLISPANPSVDVTSDVPARGVLHSLAAASLHVRSASAETPLPPGGTAIFNGCPSAPAVAVPVEIVNDGLARLPAPAGCQSAALHFDPFETIAVATPLRAGTTQSLGDFTLHIAGNADVHVVRQAEATTTPVADADVTVTIPSLRGKPIVVAEATTTADGWAHFTGLPARRDLRVAARTSDHEVTPPATLRIEPRARATVDPLTIAAPATLIVEPRIDAELRRRFPDAALESVRVQSTDPLARDERVAEGYGRDTITLDHLLPGTWQVMAVVKAGGAASPLYFDPVELHSGETRRMPLDIKPLIFTGRIVARGHGVPANVFIGGIAGTPSIRRNVVTAPDGSFQIILPAPGAYDVLVAKMPSQSFAIPVGQVDFADPSAPVEIVLPEGHLTVHVRIGDHPATDATVFATLRRDAVGGVDVLETGTRTNARGDADLTLPTGRWTITASADQASHPVEKVAVLTADGDARLEIDLNDATATFSGTVRTSSGAPVADALVECVLATGAAPQVASATTDGDGRFQIDAPLPAPRVARCGVTAPDGTLQPFQLTPATPADVVLAPSPARLTVTWPANRRGALWLADTSGGLLDLTLWMSRSLGTHRFLLPALAPGQWRLLRVGSMADWLSLAERGTAQTLATVTLAPADDKAINAESASPQ